MAPIYKTAGADGDEMTEMDRELAFQRSLTTAQRIAMMLSASRPALETLIRRGHRKPAEVVKRS